MKRLAVGILSCIATVSAFAATTYKWQGASGGSWFVPGNWTGGVAGQYPGQDPVLAADGALMAMPPEERAVVSAENVCYNLRKKHGD